MKLIKTGDNSIPMKCDVNALFFDRKNIVI